MNTIKTILLFLLIFVFSGIASAQSECKLNLMPQVAFGTRNDIQRPNNEGTLIHFNKDFKRKNDAVFSPRIELEYSIKRHHIIATAAFLTDKFEGTPTQNIWYNGELFAIGNNINSVYRFNTYRLGYRFRLVNKPRINFELGATVLLRDAYISLENSTQKTKFSNVGVAPLLSYSLEWKATDNMSLLTYGDAFAVKAGRAEDIFAGFKYRFSPLISAMAGYRLLEGGSDSDDVYTMATFHYISLGVGFNF